MTNPIDVRGPVTHLIPVVVVDVPPADIVTPETRMFGLPVLAISYLHPLAISETLVRLRVRFRD